MIILRNKYFNEPEETAASTSPENTPVKKSRGNSAAVIGTAAGLTGLGLTAKGLANARALSYKIRNSEWGNRSKKISNKLAILDAVKDEIKNSGLKKKIKDKKINSLELKRIPLVEKYLKAKLRDEKLGKVKQEIGDKVEDIWRKMALTDAEQKKYNKVGNALIGAGLATGLTYGGYKLYKHHQNKKKQEENDN